MVFNTKLYLVKIKVGNDFNDEDLLWAIGHQGVDNIDMEDFKNIVMVLNKKGLWTPILADKGATWKSIKTSADLKALGHNGKPILLLEEVLTFKKILEFAYMQGVLADPKGQEVLNAKNEELESKKSGTSVSLTLEQASSNAQSVSDVVGLTMKRSREIFAGTDSQQGGGCITNSDYLAQPGGSTDTVITNPKGTIVATLDLTDAVIDTMNKVGSEVEVVEAHATDENRIETDGFDPSQFNVDDIDNELDQLEDPAELDLVKKNSRYKAITKTLRKSLSFSCLTVQQLMKQLDAKEAQLREIQALSSKQVVEGLKPEMKKVQALDDKVGSVIEAIKALDEKSTNEAASVLSDIKDVASKVAQNTTAAQDQANSIVRHLGTFGLVDSGYSFNVPNYLNYIFRILNEEIAPVFRAGNVYAQDNNGQPLPPPVVGAPGQPLPPSVPGQPLPPSVPGHPLTPSVPGHPLPYPSAHAPAMHRAYLATQGIPHSHVLPSPVPASIPTNAGNNVSNTAQLSAPQSLQRMANGPYHGPPATVPVPAATTGNGLLQTPVKFQTMQQNYLPVAGVAPPPIATAPTLPSHRAVTPQDLGTFIGPPGKKQRTDGTNAVRSLFSNFSQQNYASQQPTQSQQSNPSNLFTRPQPHTTAQPQGMQGTNPTLTPTLPNMPPSATGHYSSNRFYQA